MVSIMDYGTAPQQQQQQQQQPGTTQQQVEQHNNDNMQPPKSAISQSSIELQLTTKNPDLELAKRALKLDLVNATNEFEDVQTKSPKSPLSNSVRGSRLPHQKSLTAQIDLVEDRKTLRDALYQGIFHRHRRTIFAVGSFLRMLRSRNSQYNTIRSSSEGDDIDETR